MNPEREPDFVDAILRVVCWGLALQVPLVGVGLWMHNLWPALGLGCTLGSLLWVAMISDRIFERRDQKRRASLDGSSGEEI